MPEALEEQEAVENTSAEETPTVETPVETPVEDIPQDTEEPHELNGEMFTAIETKVTRGPKKGQPLYVFKIEPNPAEFIARFRKAVGAENFDKCVIDMIRTSCKDATQQAASTAEDGVPTTEGFNKGLVEWYEDDTRRSGVHVKDIKAKMMEIFAKTNPLIARAFDPKAVPLTEQESREMAQLSVEFSVLNAKLEKIEGARKGKKAAKAAKK